MSTDEIRVLWTLMNGARRAECRLVSCCSGAELQLVGDRAIELRELYPDHSSLYERARELRRQLEGAGWRAREA